MTIELPRVTLRFRFSFFAVLTLMLLCGNEAVALCCFLSSALHECGHLLLLLLFRAFPEDVTFGAGGR